MSAKEMRELADAVSKEGLVKVIQDKVMRAIKKAATEGKYSVNIKGTAWIEAENDYSADDIFSYSDGIVNWLRGKGYQVNTKTWHTNAYCDSITLCISW